MVKTTTSMDKPTINDIQIEMGILRQLKIDYDILVVADGWLSWFFVLKGFNYRSIKLFMKSSLSVKEEFKAVEKYDCILKQEELDQWFGDHLTGLVLVHGSKFFSEWLYNGHTIETTSKSPLLMIWNTQLLNGFQVSHAEVGGVTSEKWSVYREKMK